MPRLVHHGFTMIEVLMVVVLMGVGVAGLARLVTLTVRGEGEARRRMEARILALRALEEGSVEGAASSLAVEFLNCEDFAEVRVSWPEGNRPRDLRLRRFHE